MEGAESAVCEKALRLLVRKDVLARGRFSEVAFHKLKSISFLSFSFCSCLCWLSFPRRVCFTVINISHSQRTSQCVYPPEARLRTHLSCKSPLGNKKKKKTVEKSILTLVMLCWMFMSIAMGMCVL